MMDVFTVFRLFGILPYKIVDNHPVFCRKWHLYSWLFAAVILISTFSRGLMYLFFYSSDDKDIRSCVYLFLLKWEPMFFFANTCVVYYTIMNKETTEQGIKIMKLLNDLQSRRTGGRRITWYTFTASIILLFLGVVHYMHITEPTSFNIIDIFIGYTTVIPFTIQILQLSVYFDIIFAEYCRLEQLTPKKWPEDTIETLLQIKSLRQLKKKIEYLYYHKLICQEVNGLIYFILAIRGTYDFIYHYYTSATISLIVLIWASFDLPLQIYLVHLSEVTDIKVKVIGFYKVFNCIIYTSYRAPHCGYP